MPIHGAHRAAGRTAAGIAAAAVAALLATPGVAQASCAKENASPRDASNAELTRAMVCLINERRSGAGVRKLEPRDTLKKAARSHTRVMLKRNCYSHDCGREPDLAGRLRRSGYLPAPDPLFGEVIAFHQTPKQVIASLMASAPHRRILLDPRFRHVGAGVGRGVPIAGYSDAGIITVTAVLARRR